jgi:hypothetical protein
MKAGLRFIAILFAGILVSIFVLKRAVLHIPLI